MVLGGFIKFNSSGITHGSGLASGVEIENVIQAQSYAQKIMKRCGKMPKVASAQTVMNADKVADTMKANAKFLKDLVKVKLEQVDAGLEVVEASVAMDEGLAQRETRYQQIMDRHGRNRLDTRYQQGRIQSANEGNYAAYIKKSAIDLL
jgi:hypothetical protein